MSTLSVKRSLLKLLVAERDASLRRTLSTGALLIP